MEFLFDILKKEPEYKRLSEDAGKGLFPLAASGLSAIHKALLVCALSKHLKKKILAVSYDEASAAADKFMRDDFQSMPPEMQKRMVQLLAGDAVHTSQFWLDVLQLAH